MSELSPMAAADDGLQLSPPSAAARRGRRRVLALERPTRGMGVPIAISLLPALVLFSIFFLVPLGVVIVTSLSDWGPIGLSFTWLANFSDLFSDPAFITALKNTAFFCAAGVFIQVPVGVALGIILSQRIRGWKVLRTIYFLPNIVSIAALALVYLSVYNPRYGLLNQILGALGFAADHDWLFDLNTALPAVAATWVFTAGVVMILTMAEIAAIPEEIYDAAAVDGASGWTQARHVTLPLLRNVIGVCTILVLLATIGYFDGVYIMTSGGPANHTLTLALYSFQEYSSGHWGYANAIGVVLIGLGLIAIVAIRRLFRVGERDF
ncbi:MAG TPA: sugar ABC transporter permease [Solirubrobacterales bacterium]|nr:sugar ABC transporter permease [Solirubrobacterales bacterium]